ncbi:sulfite exporter TauE/SafE family protein [Rhodovulum sp. DZ06]|uniref:sulfite exporter TauE/SafE family protein n=1 Tax=Rhodovulum sp. DZ06 TaxID=3425126 RepID=UPI003D332C82
MDAYSTAEIAALVGGLLAASVLGGLLAGLLGVGGGIVIVPALFWLFTLVKFDPALSMHMAVATSLATIVATSISSARAHHKKGGVDADLLRRWAPFMAFGALAGGLGAKFIDPAGLKAIFGVIALLVAANLATPKTLVVAQSLPASRAGQGGIATFIGGLSALMGIGGGTLSVPILAAFSYPIRRAVGTAAAFGFVIAVPAAIGFVIAGWGVPDRPPLSLGYVSVPAALLILPVTTFCAPYGARLAHAVDPIWVKRAFALFLGITAFRMLSAAFG